MVNVITVAGWLPTTAGGWRWSRTAGGWFVNGTGGGDCWFTFGGDWSEGSGVTTSPRTMGRC